MADILDTIPDFDVFAKKAFLEVPVMRDQMWRQVYEAGHREVFEAFYAGQPGTDGRKALVRELSRVQKLTRDAAPVMKELIEEVEPAVRGALGMPAEPSPGHVLIVGPYSTNVLVGRLAGRVTLFHCLEWFTSAEGARVLVAHEDAHAWHEIATGAGPAPADLAATAFYEGVASQVSRAVVPGRDEADHFWFGHAGFEDWLPWCREHRVELLELFAAALDDPEASERFFGAGLVKDHWRVGYYLADEIVGGLGMSLGDLARTDPAAGGSAVRQAVGAKPAS